jgi:hypothetical protein
MTEGSSEVGVKQESRGITEEQMAMLVMMGLIGFLSFAWDFPIPKMYDAVLVGLGLLGLYSLAKAELK